MNSNAVLPVAALAVSLLATGCVRPHKHDWAGNFGHRGWADVGKSCNFDSPTYSVPRPFSDSLRSAGPWEDSLYGTSPTIAERISGGWGGFAVHYIGGWTTIYLVDTTKARTAVRELIAERVKGITPDVRIREGRWTYIQLYEWNSFIWSHLRGLHLTGTSFDEARNRLIYFFVDEPTRHELERRLAESNVPCWLVEDGLLGQAYALTLR